MTSVAFLGLPGSYSHIAGNKYFKEKAEFISCESFEDIFNLIDKDKATLGILPLENSLSGSIYQSYDLLMDKSLKIIGEVVLKIRHCLYAKGSGKIKRCFSHPEVFKQCRNFFKKNPHIEQVYVGDTSSAALTLSKTGTDNDSAIGSIYLKNLYNLTLIEKDIQDNPNNYTRFVIVGKKMKKYGNKVSLVFSVEHKPGSLFKTLEPYSRLGLNLTKIESRPLFGKPWEYIFCVDFVINGQKDILEKVLLEMKEHVNFITVLGLYEKGRIYDDTG